MAKLMSIALLGGAAGAAASSLPGESAYTAPYAFPTSVFSDYYVKPGPSAEPQPVIYDPVLKYTYPLNLTDPKTIPTVNTDPAYFPKSAAHLSEATADVFIQLALDEIYQIIGDDEFGLISNCSKCLAALSVGKLAAQFAPQYVPDAMISLCQTTGWASNSSCQSTYEATSFGAIWTTVLAYADVTGLDGQYICASLSSTFCSAPTTIATNTTDLFPKPKPENVTVPPPSGERVKVLHISDFHLDPRYSVSAEANCSSGMCCRYSASATEIEAPAPLFGAYKCDVPYDLGLAALQAIGPMTGTSKKHPLAWTIYTGDLVSHDSVNQLSHDYVEYVETSLFDLFKKYITGPIFFALGNHDTSPPNIDAPHSLPGPLGQQFSWNYDHLSSLWQHEGWIDAQTAQEAALHYGAYSVKTHYGLRIITLNQDFIYKSNYLNFINTTNPDNSGVFSFLISELQAAEDAGERVWIMGHVLTGWDGTNPLPNPTDMFYQIVDRYSPHVIANIFFGHTHEDQVMIYYANNGTVQSRDTAQTMGWIGPSITPLTNLNSGFRLYEVDTGSFEIYEAYTFYAEVETFAELETSGPTYQFEYSTRDAYGPAVNWPTDAPLNATFWHDVTEAMEADHSLATVFNGFQGKSSPLSPNCTNDACTEAKICYMRSGSVALGQQCPQGYGSVQSPFKPK